MQTWSLMYTVLSIFDLGVYKPVDALLQRMRRGIWGDTEVKDESIVEDCVVGQRAAE